MEARIRQWVFGFAPMILAATGCSFFDRSTDRLVDNELKEAKTHMRRPATDPLGMNGPTSIVRPQAPLGPIAPGIIPNEPEPTPLATPQLGSTSAKPGVQPLSLAVPPQNERTRVQPLQTRNGTEAETRVKVVATVGADGLITDDDVLIMMRQRAREYITLQGNDRVAKEKDVYKEELRRLIERELVINEFLAKVRKNKPQLVDELWTEAGNTADRQMREIRKGAGITNESDFAAMLKSQGVEMKTFRRQMERAALSNMYVGQFMREKSQTITLHQVQQYYRDHADDFRIEDRVKWQDFFLSIKRFQTTDEAKLYADWAHKSLHAGADFAEFTKKHGHGDSALRSGEGSGTKRGEILPQELEKIIFELPVGKCSELIPSQTGFHIVKVVERDVAGVRPLDAKLQSEIRGKLTELNFKQDREKMIMDLWRKTTVTIIAK